MKHVLTAKSEYLLLGPLKSLIGPSNLIVTKVNIRASMCFIMKLIPRPVYATVGDDL